MTGQTEFFTLSDTRAEGVEHQTWLDTAPAVEIAEWIVTQRV